MEGVLRQTDAILTEMSAYRGATVEIRDVSFNIKCTVCLSSLRTVDDVRHAGRMCYYWHCDVNDADEISIRLLTALQLYAVVCRQHCNSFSVLLLLLHVCCMLSVSRRRCSGM
jgi:hypothetical protein